MIKNNMHIKATANNCFTLIVSCSSSTEWLLHLCSLAGLDAIFYLLALTTFDTEDILIAILVEAILVKVLFKCMVRFESWSEDHAFTSCWWVCTKSGFMDLSSLMQAFILLYSSYSSNVKSTQFFKIFISSLRGFFLRMFFENCHSQKTSLVNIMLSYYIKVCIDFYIDNYLII